MGELGEGAPHDAHAVRLPQLLAQQLLVDGVALARLHHQEHRRLL